MGKETEERKESSEGRVVEVAILERDLQNTHLLLTGKGKKLGSKKDMGKETEERKESSEGRVVEVAILERDLQNTHLLLTGKGKKLGSKENIPMHRVFECGKQLPKTKNKEDKQKWHYFQVASINLFWAFPRFFYKIRPIPERCKRNYFFSPHLQELDKKKKKKNK
jgi:hypothetical protein